jgi:SAM-dependent methyltransferase
MQNQMARTTVRLIPRWFAASARTRIMNQEFWSKYASEFSSHYNEEMAKFVRDLAVSLKAQSILEVGCSSGNDLRLFPNNLDVNGVDENKQAIKIAQEDLAGFKFKIGSIVELPYEDLSMDLVFTRNVLNYVENSDIARSFDELFRVSRKYIFNIELFSESEDKIGDGQVDAWGRNVRKHWLDFKVKIISNVDMHEEIDPKKSRFTLVRKI